MIVEAGRLERLPWPVDANSTPVWEALRRVAPTETIFLTPEWLGAWHRNLAPDADPVILFAHLTDGSLALAPLVRQPIGRSLLRLLRLMGTGVSDYLDLLLPVDASARHSCLATILDGLLDRPNKWDALDLLNLPAESPTATKLGQFAGARGLLVATLPGYPRPAITLESGWEGYLATRPGRFRYNLRSRLRRLEKLGEVRFRSLSRPDEVRAALPVLVNLHARRWAGQHTSTIFSSSARGRDFYAAACPLYAERGLLEVSLLELDGQAVAGALNFIDRGTYYYYVPAWEPELAALAPSSLLLAHLIERACALGLRRFDFMLGDEPYKAQWATETRHTVQVVIGGPTPRGRAAFLTLVGWRRLRQRLRQSAMLQRARRHGIGPVRQMFGLAGGTDHDS